MRAIAATVLLICNLCGAAFAAPPVSDAARLGGDMQRTRFVADLSAKVDVAAFLLADPQRLIIDLPEVRFQMPQGLGATGTGLVAAFRYGLLSAGRSRIVIDLAAPAIVERIAVDTTAAGKARLTVDLVRATPANFKAKLGGRFTVAGYNAAPARAPVAANPAAIAPRKAGKPLIVLDPGHGGVDPGAVGVGNVLEKTITLEFCLELKKRIEATGRAEVAMTRDTDVFVALNDRMEFARSRHASLFLSFHADALDPKNPLLSAKAVAETRGATLYTASEEASDAAAGALAATENRSDILAGVEMAVTPSDDLANILVDLIRRETKNHSVSFAKTLLRQLTGKVPLGTKPYRHANFRVLKAPDVPSVLVELGFLSQAEDVAAMTSTAWRSAMGEAVASAIDGFLGGTRAAAPL